MAAGFLQWVLSRELFVQLFMEAIARTSPKQRVFHSLTGVYLISAALVLLFAAYSKWTTRIAPEQLQLKDPFIAFLTEGQLLHIVAIVEIIVSVIIVCCIKRSPLLGVTACLWLSTLFVLYRLGFVLAPESYGRSCRCLGGVGSVLGARSDEVAPFMLAYLLVGGLVLFIGSFFVGHIQQHRGPEQVFQSL